MHRTRGGDLAAGVLTTGFGAAVLVHVRGFPDLPGGQPGPALFPGIVGALMMMFGVALVAQSLRRRGTDGTGGGGPGSEQAPGSDPADAEDSPAPLSRRTAAGNALAVLGAIAVYILVSDLLGFALTMVLLLAGLMLKLGTRAWVAAAAAVTTTLVATVIFRQLLLVPLPTGPFGL